MYTTATAYFATLTEAMLTMQVSNRQGDSINVDQGAEQAIQMISEVQATDRKVLLAGNGGSASIVSHVQNDLFKRVGVKSLVFTEQPLLTALANDNGYESVFEWPLEQWAQAGDLFIAVSSSGKSENILRAGRVSLERGCRFITFSGFGPDNPLRKMGDLNFYVRSDSYGYVETAHAAVTHFITDRAMILRDPSAQN